MQAGAGRDPVYALTVALTVGAMCAFLRRAIIAGALAGGGLLTSALPTSATESPVPPTTYSARAEAVGWTTIDNDAGFAAPYADPHAPHTIGTISSDLAATGFAAVLNPGTLVNGLSSLSQAKGGPVVPDNPTVVETRAGSENDASFGGSALVEVTSHSDAVPSTRQRAVAASDRGSAGAPLVSTGLGSATTSAALAGAVLRSMADVVLEDVSVPGAGFAARSVHSHVDVEWAAGAQPTVSRQIEVVGATVNGQPTEAIPEGKLPPPPSGGPAIATVKGQAGPQPDGSFAAHSDGLAVSFPVPGTLQTVTVLLGSTQVVMSLGLPPAQGLSTGVIASAPASAPALPPPAAPVADTTLPTEPPATAGTHPRVARHPALGHGRLASVTEGSFPLVWLYLCWLCLGAALVTAACLVVLGRGVVAGGPRPELFD